MPPEDRHSGTLQSSGANVKSGSFTGNDGDTGSVTFATAFSSAPEVALTLFHFTLDAMDIVYLTGSSTTNFSWYIKKGHGGAGHSWTVHWIATDAGDP